MARALILVAVLPLSGCVTTQLRNDRADLQATRLLTSRKPLLVTTPAASVRPTGVAIVRGHGRAAIVVKVANDSSRAVSDLPIAVGVGRTQLNRRGSYFQNHVASLAAGRRATWVFTTRRHVPRGRPFALVGEPSLATKVARLPALAVAGTLRRVTVRNGSAIPQYTVPVYAVARRNGHIVAAGATTLAHLGSRGSVGISLKLVGDPRGAQLDLEALPTIFS